MYVLTDSITSYAAVNTSSLSTTTDSGMTHRLGCLEHVYHQFLADAALAFFSITPIGTLDIQDRQSPGVQGVSHTECCCMIPTVSNLGLKCRYAGGKGLVVLMIGQSPYWLVVFGLHSFNDGQILLIVDLYPDSSWTDSWTAYTVDPRFLTAPLSSRAHDHVLHKPWVAVPWFSALIRCRGTGNVSDGATNYN